jgi:hypothetical protein
MNKETTIKELLDMLRLSSITSVKFRKFDENIIMISVTTDSGLNIMRAIRYSELNMEGLDVLEYMWKSMMDNLLDAERSENNGN